MTAAPIHQDNTFHAARATADRDWRIPIVKAKGVVAPLPSPVEFITPEATPAWVGWLKSAAILTVIVVLCWTGLVFS